MEIRVQVAYHCKIDPTKQTLGAIGLPEQITRTISVGDEFMTEKVSSNSLSLDDRAALIAFIEKEACEATRTAKPLGSLTDGRPAAEASEDDEMSAF